MFQLFSFSFRSFPSFHFFSFPITYIDLYGLACQSACMTNLHSPMTSLYPFSFCRIWTICTNATENCRLFLHCHRRSWEYTILSTSNYLHCRNWFGNGRTRDLYQLSLSQRGLSRRSGRFPRGCWLCMYPRLLSFGSSSVLDILIILSFL